MLFFEHQPTVGLGVPLYTGLIVKGYKPDNKRKGKTERKRM